MKIIFLQTGGTIDKDYPRTTRGYAFEINEPSVKRILEKIDPAFTYEIKTVFRKDSLDINEKDRAELLRICNSLEEDNIIITHGTDTMIETARILSSINDKRIIITGAFRPERFVDSDAPVNLGLAMGAISLIDPGIYIAMNGRIYNWDKVARDPESGQFVSK